MTFYSTKVYCITIIERIDHFQFKSIIFRATLNRALMRLSVSNCITVLKGVNCEIMIFLTSKVIFQSALPAQ